MGIIKAIYLLSRAFLVSRLSLATENDYNRDVFNGDLGWLTRSTGSSRTWW